MNCKNNCQRAVYNSAAISFNYYYSTHRCQALDEIGDTSSLAERKRYFKEVDVDQSDGVDFEEYLEVYTVHASWLPKTGMGGVCLNVGYTLSFSNF